MKERPILMSTPMVQATLEGRKTMTRRIVKPRKKLSPTSEFQFEPFGKVGDLLWVREAWQKDTFNQEPHIEGFIYKADGEKVDELVKWKPSIFMPKEAARIWLEITNIKVERLFEISEEDAKAEGAVRAYQGENGVFYQPSKETVKILGECGTFFSGFAAIWQSINGEESWNENPWVWVIEFKVLSTTGKP